MAEFADDAILGTALELDKQKLSPDELFKKLRALIFRGLTDHELGHTMGLRHNFAASTDALNYSDEYWNIRATVPDSSTWDSEHKLSEYAYASVMDYGARFNSDVHGLGKYDTAAIRFGYGQLFDLIDMADESAWTGLRSDISLWDYTNLPLVTGGTDRFNSAATTVLPYKAFIDLWTDEFRKLATNGGTRERVPRAPLQVLRRHVRGKPGLQDLGSRRQPAGDGVQRDRAVPELLRLQRLPARAGQLGHRSLSDPAAGALLQPLLGGVPVLLLPVGLHRTTTSASICSWRRSIRSTRSRPSCRRRSPACTARRRYSPTVATFPVDDYGLINEGLCLPGKPKLQIGLPDAKPFYIDFSDDYYYQLTRVGSLLEKLQALVALTSTESRFFRVDELSDVAARSSINYYRLFRDEVVKLLSGVIRNDPSNYAATLAGTGTTTSYQPTPVVDLETFGRRECAAAAVRATRGDSRR